MRINRKNEVRVTDPITFGLNGMPDGFSVFLAWGEFRDKAPGRVSINLDINRKGDKYRYFQLTGGSTLGLVALRGNSPRLSIEDVLEEPSLLYPLVKTGIENSKFFEVFWCTCKNNAPHTHEIRSLPPSYPKPSSWRETNTLLTNSQKLSQALDKILDN